MEALIRTPRSWGGGSTEEITNGLASQRHVLRELLMYSNLPVYLVEYAIPRNHRTLQCHPDGDIDGVDVSGHTFVLMVDSPPLMSEGGWNVGVIVDDGASQEQVEAIGAVVSGSLGGPPAALGPLLGNFLGIEQMPVSVTSENGEHTVTFGDSSYTGRPHVNGSGDVVELTGVDTHPAGPVLGMAPVSTSSISAMGISFGGEGLSGFANPFNWAA